MKKYKYLYSSNAHSKLSITGIGSACIVFLGPFLYGNFNGRGVLLFAGLLFLLAMLAQAIVNKGEITLLYVNNYVLYTLLIMLLWEAACFIWSPSYDSDKIYSFIKRAALCLLLFSNVYTDKDRRLIKYGSSLITVLLIFMMLKGGQLTYQGRYTFNILGYEQDPNYTCYFLVVPIIYMLSIILNSRCTKLSKTISILIEIILFIGLIATGSRGGVLGISSGILSYIIISYKFNFKNLLLLSVFGVIGTFLLMNLVDNFLSSVILSRYSFERVATTGGTGRVDLWIGYLSEIQSDLISVILGHGNGSSSLKEFCSHNYAIQILYEYGIFGIIFTLLFYVQLFKKLIANKNTVAIASLIAALVLAIGLNVDNMLQYWICIITIYIIGSERNTNS